MMRKIFSTSDGRTTTIEPTRELDEVFAFIQQKNCGMTCPDVCVMNDRNGWNIYLVRIEPVIWCVCYPEDHPMARQIAEMFRPLQQFTTPASEVLA